MADNSTKLTQFTDITGVDAERAKFYLESSDWQLEVALASFYENDGDDMPEIVDVSASPVPEDDETPASHSDTAVSGSNFEPDEPKPKKKQPTSRNTKFATVASMNATNSDSSDEEEGQAFYAGGSRTSGQQVLGPKKKKDIVAEMFKSVQEHGAEVVDPSRPSAGRGSASSFEGQGYRLGQSSSDTEVVGAPAARSKPPTETVLKLWKEGFSINDEPIRPYGDPENKEFLDSVRRGEVPMELVRQARGEEVHLNMEDHRHEEYVPAKIKTRAFTGKGNLLGSPSPTAVGLTQPVTTADRESNEAQARASVPLNQDLPTTTLQIRLVDGSRLIGRFNTTSTVADVRTYIATARPQFQHQSFTLLSTFPSKELSDGDQTLDEAGVLNASLLQRLK